MSTEMMQDAFRLSREGFQDGYSEIARLVAAGRHVVVERSIAYCPRTDAILGSRYVALFDCDTRANALAKLDEHLAAQESGDADPECDYYVLPHGPDTSPSAGDDDDELGDLPF